METRPRITQDEGKRTFFITDAQLLPSYASDRSFSRAFKRNHLKSRTRPEVLLMRYTDSEGDSLEIIWDPRRRGGRLSRRSDSSRRI